MTTIITDADLRFSLSCILFALRSDFSNSSSPSWVISCQRDAVAQIRGIKRLPLSESSQLFLDQAIIFIGLMTSEVLQRFNKNPNTGKAARPSILPVVMG